MFVDSFRVLVPDSSKLSGMADQLSEDLQHQNEILSQLMKNVSYGQLANLVLSHTGKTQGTEHVPAFTRAST